MPGNARGNHRKFHDGCEPACAVPPRGIDSAPSGPRLKPTRRSFSRGNVLFVLEVPRHAEITGASPPPPRPPSALESPRAGCAKQHDFRREERSAILVTPDSRRQAREKASAGLSMRLATREDVSLISAPDLVPPLYPRSRNPAASSCSADASKVTSPIPNDNEKRAWSRTGGPLRIVPSHIASPFFFFSRVPYFAD